MLQYQILVLPLVALALLLFFPLLSKNSTSSRGFKSHRHRRTIAGRVAVLILLLASLLTAVFPIEGLAPLVQGIVVSALMFIPAGLMYLMATRRYSSSDANVRDEDLAAVAPPKMPGAAMNTGNRQMPNYAVDLSAANPNHSRDNRQETLRPSSASLTDTRTSPSVKVSSARDTEEIASARGTISENSENTDADALLPTDADIARSERRQAGLSTRRGLIESERAAQSPQRSRREFPAAASPSESQVFLPEETPGRTVQRTSGIEAGKNTDSTHNYTEVAPAERSATLADLSSSIDHALKTTPKNMMASKMGTDDTERKYSNVKAILKPSANTESIIYTAATEHDRRDSSEQVGQQLDNVSRLMQYHDLDEADLTTLGEEVVSSRGNTFDTLVDRNMRLLTTSGQQADLSKLSTNQIAHLVSTLRKDKRRLQKLVIAQHANMEAERQAHDRTRTAARDAITIMRVARDAQKNAEKIARRERSERQRIEQQYKKVTKLLGNAMSIVELRMNKDNADTVHTSGDGKTEPA